MEKSTVYYATGKRKNAIARTWMTPGKGEIVVNERPMEEYFTVETSKIILAQPLVLTDNLETYDIRVKVKGGGISGQAGAVRHGITKALLLADPDYHRLLGDPGLRDDQPVPGAVCRRALAGDDLPWLAESPADLPDPGSLCRNHPGRSDGWAPDRADPAGCPGADYRPGAVGARYLAPGPAQLFRGLGVKDPWHLARYQ